MTDWLCVLCGTQFQRQDGVVDHLTDRHELPHRILKSSTEFVDDEVRCKICHRRFDSVGHANDHLNDDHDVMTRATHGAIERVDTPPELDPGEVVA